MHDSLTSRCGERHLSWASVFALRTLSTAGDRFSLAAVLIVDSMGAFGALDSPPEGGLSSAGESGSLALPALGRALSCSGSSIPDEVFYCNDTPSR